MITLTFTLYDENINEIKYPAGVTPLDILVSSIERERYEENIKGIPGPIDYGFDFKEREITLKFQMEHYHDTFDFRLQRDELYNIFSSHNHLYVSDNLVPTRVIKLQVDSQFTPERYGYWYSTLEVTGKTTGLPFWRTKWKTQELELEGYNADSDKFGFADNINLDYPNYTFTTNSFYVWNGGNVTIDPRNMDLKIRLYQLKTDGNFKLTNHTTGETFEYLATRTGNTVDMDGIQAFVGMQANRLRETNRKYISLAPGLNKISYTGGEMINIQFDFPFYFK
ncbi:phage tail domain-containing protein [Staphylococcus haemolyticus]|uniref:phage tail domain-containing protein n=1 Tax=Staphylococcus haemolyticus TaxID=1283 RepID=UPI0029050305|nr:phage tail domain-containing protein [Staphylococcus haemolyticus]MDU0567268.1 phage tail family protein [Staphylococcus haemolyticus]